MPGLIHNQFNVPKTQWGAWTQQAQGVFTSVYSKMTKSPRNFQAGFLFPEIKPIEKAAWEDIAWNTAWAAADYTQRFSK